jgi:hypothetical protein
LSACYDGAMPVPASVPKWRFTADEYQRMVQARILTKYDRVELIDGEIVGKMTIGPRHSAAVRSVRQYVRGQSLAPELLPECVIATSELLVE